MKPLTNNDTQLGKYITYGKSVWKSTRVVYSSGITAVDGKTNTLTVCLFGIVLRIILPQLIKPAVQYNYEYRRDFGFSIRLNFFQLFYGAQPSIGNKSSYSTFCHGLNTVSLN